MSKLHKREAQKAQVNKSLRAQLKGGCRSSNPSRLKTKNNNSTTNYEEDQVQVLRETVHSTHALSLDPTWTETHQMQPVEQLQGRRVDADWRMKKDPQVSRIGPTGSLLWKFTVKVEMVRRNLEVRKSRRQHPSSARCVEVSVPFSSSVRLSQSSATTKCNTNNALGLAAFFQGAGEGWLRMDHAEAPDSQLDYWPRAARRDFLPSPVLN